jgi:hypothetical protein
MKPVEDRSEPIAMKSFIRAAAVAALLYAPVAAFAQSNDTVTQAQVKTESHAQTQSQSQSEDKNNSGYGGSVSHSSQSGARMARPGDRSSIYFGD